MKVNDLSPNGRKWPGAASRVRVLPAAVTLGQLKYLDHIEHEAPLMHLRVVGQNTELTATS